MLVPDLVDTKTFAPMRNPNSAETLLASTLNSEIASIGGKAAD